MSATTSRSSAVAKIVSRLVLGSFVTVLLVLPNVGDRTSPKEASAVVPPCATTTTVDPLVTTTTNPLATTTTTDPLATTTTTIDPCATTTTTTTTEAPTTTAAATTTTAAVTTTTSGAIIPLVPTTTVDPSSVTTTVDPAATTTTVAPTTTVPASVSSTTVVSVTTPTLAFDAPPETTRPIQQLTPETTTTTSTTTTIASTTTTIQATTTTVVAGAAGSSVPGPDDRPIGTQETVKTVWVGDPTVASTDQQKQNLEVAAYIVKDLFINSNLPMPVAPVAVDGRLELAGSASTVKGTVTGTASGFLPGATGRLYAASEPVHLGAFTADAQGVIAFDVTVPSKLTGAHHLVMVGTDTTGNVKASVLPITIIGGVDDSNSFAAPDGGTPSGGASTAPATLSAAPADDPNQMAMTGADVFGLVFAAVAFIVAGTLTAYRNRKLRPNA